MGSTNPDGRHRPVPARTLAARRASTMDFRIGEKICRADHSAHAAP